MVRNNWIGTLLCTANGVLGWNLALDRAHILVPLLSLFAFGALFSQLSGKKTVIPILALTPILIMSGSLGLSIFLIIYSGIAIATILKETSNDK